MKRIEPVMHEEANTVMTVPLADLEAMLRQVETWPAFLPDLESTRTTSHRRYVFTVRQHSRSYDVPICLNVHPREHEVAWRALKGPAWNGILRLQPVDEKHTRVHLELTVHPRSFGAQIAEWISSHRAEAELALQRLSHVVEDGQQPAAVRGASGEADS
jgi:uncharacterized membrane protein